MQILVRAESLGKKLNRLLIFIDGRFIGEYERTQTADIKRKTDEITVAGGLLLSLFETHGPLVVRWDRKIPEKSIRREDGVRVGAVPREAWRTPSWKSSPV